MFWIGAGAVATYLVYRYVIRGSSSLIFPWHVVAQMPDHSQVGMSSGRLFSHYELVAKEDQEELARRQSSANVSEPIAAMPQSLVPSASSSPVDPCISSSTSVPDYLRTRNPYLLPCAEAEYVIRRPYIRRLAQVWSRKCRNIACLVGRPGCGRSSIVRSLMNMRNDKEYTVRGYPIGRFDLLELDPLALVGDVKSHSEIEGRVRRVLLDLHDMESCTVVLIRNLASLVSSHGVQHNNHVLRLLVEGATMLDKVVFVFTARPADLRTIIEEDTFLDGRIQPVTVEEPSQQEATEMVSMHVKSMSAHHRVQVDPATAEACVSLSSRYMPSSVLPAKAIDLLDETAALVSTCSGGSLHTKLVTPSAVAAVVASLTGIPAQTLFSDDAERLLNLEEELSTRVIGQDAAVGSVARIIRMSRTGLRHPSHRPIGCFLFTGPTGVGKTHLVKTIAKSLFSSEAAMTRIDGSEFMERHSVARLIGPPPGYVGFLDSPGILTSSVLRTPYQVVLFDECDKAHVDVWNILLHVLDEGYLNDSHGVRVDFRNTLIVLTSNQTAERVKQTMAPELRNRLDEVLEFRRLTTDDAARIVRIKLEEVRTLMMDRGVRLEIDERVLLWLVERSFDNELGARPLVRGMQAHVLDPLATLMLRGVPDKDNSVRLCIAEDGTKLEVSLIVTNH